ncbi:TetR family transcriptional regulator [Yinghuangia sp. ASG 101]|uniref:TetR/AcrR family transcriptional regulator n=1 Tax=Yinghuangia sp. ASG 101 TaxID=2896848 RepID=UPI001E2E049E|nr:TetR/AcrR family transcriptional regulator [Yinghuangia sp. ASG 101]UGQ10187.1 TetR family transcriptional regulator [Yinghuangia sp. ASG 101]
MDGTSATPKGAAARRPPADAGRTAGSGGPPPGGSGPPPRSPPTAGTPRVTRDAVLDTAMRLVRESGAQGLSMRKLAAELGVAVTSIYWHVGNREALLDELVERVLREMGTVRVRGRTPAARIASIARASRRMILERPHLISLVRERGLDSLMMLPARRALVREFAAAGVHGHRAALAVQAVQYQVAGFVLLERNLTGEPPALAQVRDWLDEVSRDDPELGRALAAPPDSDTLFDLTVHAIVDSLLRPEPPT